jgi:hypothetical protein
MIFDSEPTRESEILSKIDEELRDEIETRVCYFFFYKLELVLGTSSAYKLFLEPYQMKGISKL